MVDLIIKDIEEEVKKLQNQINMHISNIKGCEGVIIYLKQKQNEELKEDK